MDSNYDQMNAHYKIWLIEMKITNKKKEIVDKFQFINIQSSLLHTKRLMG